MPDINRAADCLRQIYGWSNDMTPQEREALLQRMLRDALALAVTEGRNIAPHLHDCLDLRIDQFIEAEQSKRSFVVVMSTIGDLFVWSAANSNAPSTTGDKVSKITARCKCGRIYAVRESGDHGWMMPPSCFNLRNPVPVETCTTCRAN